jgi:aldose 1-epimerase
VWIEAPAFTPVNDLLVPTGELRSVEGTPFDFLKPRPLGAHIAEQDRQLEIGSGYDHNFALAGGTTSLPRAVARVRSADSGITMTVLTTEPGLQLYSGNQLDGSHRGKSGKPYGRHAGLCLETQHFPDAPNRPEFPSAVLRPGRTFRSTTIFAFVT